MRPRSERNRRRDQTARLPGRWRKLRYEDMRHYHAGHAGSCGSLVCVAQAEREERVILRRGE